jgi:hypothetical protein
LQGWNISSPHHPSYTVPTNANIGTKYTVQEYRP